MSKRRLALPPRRASQRLGASPLWYKDAILYELRVRSFFDSNGDGIGDFRGVASKLDYLQDLGITALWLLPFYPSPLRDDGYDIADYTDIHPDCGSLADFELLLEEAHRRGLRVITELVLNHTSDRHPWFRRARAAAPGSVERDFYVWSDTQDRYQEARIIFKDFEQSNWTWDGVAKAYFWHRFYAHQPDLNFANPAVEEALLGVVDFWLGKGVDGLRLDAVPYLYEEEGTNCENLPATHLFLKRLRAHVDARFQDRMLLAEANQWPEDAAAYFGSGDECHMNFHFPIMPRMFMSIHMEDRFPILDILAQTPPIPASCQWALFLRNHDELTLEMVTDEERDYMYRAYAHDTEMRINLGIRRRLAPLVGNDRRKMELLNGLLLSLPGTPVLYYGDEIGMGDNVFLGDRNGVRTPMQWSADRNAGFSRANPQRMILPITIDPEYHYEAINVEAQQNNPNSLLWWTKRLIALRKRFQAFGRGSIAFLTPANHRVLAFIRKLERTVERRGEGPGSASASASAPGPSPASEGADEIVLVVANLSRFVQYVELDLSPWKGMRPVELVGNTELPAVGEAPYLLTLGGHGFYWFSLEPQQASEETELAAQYRPPVLESEGGFDRLFVGDDRMLVEDALPAFLYTRRWFSGRLRTVAAARIEQALPLGETQLLIIAVEYTEGEPERFVLPVATVEAGRAVLPVALFAILRSGGRELSIVDALEDGASSRRLLEMVAAQTRLRRGEAVVEARAFIPIDIPDVEPRNISAQHAAAAIQYGERYLLKVFRHAEEGISPELEMSRFLNIHAPGLSPAMVGAIELARGRGEPSTLAVLEAFVANEGTAFTHTLEELRRFFERVLTRYRDTAPPGSSPRTALEAARMELPPAIGEAMGTYLDLSAMLGRRTAELHLALARRFDDPAFAPEPYTTLDRRSKYQSMRNVVGKTLRLLRANLGQMPPGALANARLLANSGEQVLAVFEPLLTHRLTGLRIRTHGDYHLEQVLYTGKDFVIIDFAGQQNQTLIERRRKHSALRDVASMLLSFHFVAHVPLLDTGVMREEDRALAAPWAAAWRRWASGSFLRAYLHATDGASFLPEPEDLGRVLDTHLLERAFQELNDELVTAGDTVAIPLGSIVELCGL
jgi:maltose alpha-D-glucosyltransferase / alpha-amylase